MFRFFLSSLLVLALAARDAGAAGIKGKLKSVNPGEGVITILVGVQEKTFTVTKDTEFHVRDIRDYKPKDGLKDRVFQRKGLDITLTTGEKGCKEVVTKVEAQTGRKGWQLIGVGGQRE
jgi:hypothetical protein